MHVDGPVKGIVGVASSSAADLRLSTTLFGLAAKEQRLRFDVRRGDSVRSVVLTPKAPVKTVSLSGETEPPAKR